MTAPHVADLVLAVVERVVASSPHGAYALAPRVCPLCGHPLSPRQDRAAALNPPADRVDALPGVDALPRALGAVMGGEHGGPAHGLDT